MGGRVLKIKVMHLLPHLKMGGAETLVTDYALNIDKDKFDFVVVTVGGTTNSFNEKKLKDANIKVIHLGDEIKFVQGDSFYRRARKKIQRYRLFLKYIKIESPDIIHTHLATNEYIMPLNTKRLKIRLFHTLHSEVEVLFGEENKIYKKTTSYCVKKKNMKLIALHDRMRNEAETLFATDRCFVLNNGINMSRFKDVKVDKVAKREEMGLDEDSFILGHVGRFAASKNHTFLIDVFQKVKSECPNAHLLLIGVGELEDQIREQVEELGIQGSVSFLGNRSDIPELMNIMDVFVFPSLYEGFGNVLIEAQAVGVKCVVSNTIPREVFVTNNIVALGLDESIEKWCECIVKDKPKRKNSIGLENYDIKEVTRELELHYLNET